MQLSAGRKELDGLRAPFLDKLFSGSPELAEELRGGDGKATPDPERVLASKTARKKGLEGRLRELRSAGLPSLRESGGGSVLRSFRASEPPASDGSEEIAGLLFDQIVQLQREIERFDPAEVARTEAEAERAWQELPSLQARVQYEFERSGSFLGYVELVDPDVARQIAELEEGGLDEEERLQAEALWAPFLPGYELVPHEYYAYLMYAREYTGAGIELTRAEAQIANNLGAVIAEKQQQIQELKDRMAQFPPHPPDPPIPELIDGTAPLFQSDSRAKSPDEIRDQIEATQREIAAITPEVLALAQWEREEGAREETRVLARVEEEFKRSRTLEGYIALLAPKVAQAVTELEASQPESPALAALKAPFLEGFAQQPQDLASYVSFARQSKANVRDALDRAEAMKNQRPEWVLVELERQLRRLEEELKLLEDEIAAGGGSRRFPAVLLSSRPPARDPAGEVLFELARVNAEIEAIVPGELLDGFITGVAPQAAEKIAAVTASNATLEEQIAARA